MCACTRLRASLRVRLWAPVSVHVHACVCGSVRASRVCQSAPRRRRVCACVCSHVCAHPFTPAFARVYISPFDCVGDAGKRRGEISKLYDEHTTQPPTERLSSALVWLPDGTKDARAPPLLCSRHLLAYPWPCLSYSIVLRTPVAPALRTDCAKRILSVQCEEMTISRITRALVGSILEHVELIQKLNRGEERLVPASDLKKANTRIAALERKVESNQAAADELAKVACNFNLPNAGRDAAHQLSRLSDSVDLRQKISNTKSGSHTNMATPTRTPARHSAHSRPASTPSAQRGTDSAQSTSVAKWAVCSPGRAGTPAHATSNAPAAAARQDRSPWGMPRSAKKQRIDPQAEASTPSTPWCADEAPSRNLRPKSNSALLGPAEDDTPSSPQRQEQTTSCAHQHYSPIRIAQKAKQPRATGNMEFDGFHRALARQVYIDVTSSYKGVSKFKLRRGRRFRRQERKGSSEH